MNKKEIIKMIQTFGLSVDLDRWDEVDREFIRIDATEHQDAGCIIIYKDHLKLEVGQEKEYLQRLFINFWKKVGELELKKKLNELIILK